ncbi:cytochrome P450 [Dendrothele bispora CBS 962.96]|uniref:Cytochrome P450 n=1 Tax=Dendrothele bispora (strain CBS 962.96) TaxID=1314807 RepID=A0A4S8ML65_DENBC|nr:cytochrome P450 [Dendrothele bispora CBS 962.96]
MTFQIEYGLVILLLAYSAAALLRRNKTRYPPGPLPSIQTWKYFDSLSKQYGPIFRLNLAGSNMVVLARPEDAEELLGRRSSNYSSRPPLIYAGKYQSNNKRMVLLPYGERLRLQRVAFHQMLQPRVIGAYESMQELESAKLLSDILESPLNNDLHCQRFAASMVFYLSYGKRLDDNGQDLAAISDVLKNFVRDTTPGAHLVDTITVLDYLPDVLAPWRKKALERHEMEVKLYTRLIMEVKQKIDDGNTGFECFAARLWDQKDSLGFDLEDMAYVAGTAFEAGTDTTASTILWFLMAMLLYPNTMKKAQAELDAVMGSEGKFMPGFAHINQLPYCVALTKEVFRWAPAAPGGFPHYSETDDEYKGFRIKSKTMVVPNIWSMHHNEEEFPDPYAFNPERFMAVNTEEFDSFSTGHYGFGFGRRQCPGRHLAGKTIWIAIVRMLWAFSIEPVRDKDGVPVKVDPNNCTSGMTSRPVDFPLKITPRSKAHVESIKKEWASFANVI